jgi:spermidine/putrescine transport system permease protein
LDDLAHAEEIEMTLRRVAILLPWYQQSLAVGSLTGAAISVLSSPFAGHLVPIIIPDVTMAVMLLIFFFQSFGILELITGVSLTTGLHTIILAHIAFNISFVAVVVRARLAQFDRSLEEAAADLYANRWRTFWKVTFPLILPGVAGGALLALTLSLDDVVVTQFVSGAGATTLPVYVFGLVRRGVTPLINAVSVVMLVASMVLVGISLGLQRGRSGRPAEELADPGAMFEKAT